MSGIVSVDTSADDDPVIEEDDWNLPMDFALFARHERHPVYFDYCVRNARDHWFYIECVESLTPVDMMSLSDGTHDTTGHCVWMGAFLLIACLAADDETLRNIFSNKNVIELGCGTGIGGLAVLLNPSRTDSSTREERGSHDHSTGGASFLLFTDADPDALRLCERNCDINFDKSDGCDSERTIRNDYRIQALKWGQTPLPEGTFTDAQGQTLDSFDVVLATDVLYDIGLLPALFSTAAACLKERGVFVLSHVPRACYNSDNPPAQLLDPDNSRPFTNDNDIALTPLEAFIIRRATSFDFQLLTIIRPCHLQAKEHELVGSPTASARFSDAINAVTLEEMDQVGAAVFVFERIA